MNIYIYISNERQNYYFDENFKPILEELENDEPSINLQWIFNWMYRDRIK